MFNTIEKTISSEIIEKKSKFIANVYYIENEEMAEKIIKETKKKYYDARHNCYAYSFIDQENNIINKSSDDGEPSGTAGLPILNVITSNNFANILVIVTRYFGGILLGTGGLVRAYTSVTINALEKANVIQKDFGFEIQVIVKYEDVEKLKYYLKQNSLNISNIEYGENVKLNIELIELDDVEKIKSNFNILKYEVIGKKFILRGN